MTGLSDDTCPFCAIVAGDDPDADIACEDRDWLALFPLRPATPGHTMVVPREHVRNLWQLDAALANSLMAGVLRVGRAIDAALEPEGLNLITSAGEAAEQTVFHLHIHLVPRWRDDGFGRIWPPEHAADAQITDEVAQAIRAKCSGSERRS